MLVVGLVNQPTPLKGGILVPTPPLLLVPGPVAGASGALAFSVHGGGGPTALLFVQAVVPAGATADFSNAIELEIGAP